MIDALFVMQLNAKVARLEKENNEFKQNQEDLKQLVMLLLNKIDSESAIKELVKKVYV